MIVHRKTFFLGLFMSVVFVVTLGWMFTPVFNGENAFQASDHLFNSISKGSTYYIPELTEKNAANRGVVLELNLEIENERLAERATTLLEAAGMNVTPGTGSLALRGDFGHMIDTILADSEAMFNNNGTRLSEAYGFDEREAMYVWWKTMKAFDLALKQNKRFAEAAYLNEVVTKGVEVGYNYYGIDAQKASTKTFVLTFALVFYVFYTLWWGYAIYFLSDGVGLKMTGGAKKEV